MEEKILEILKDNKEWNSSLEYTAKELLNLFSVSGCFSLEELHKHSAESVYNYIVNEFGVKLTYEDWIKSNNVKMYDFGKYLNNR